MEVVIDETFQLVQHTIDQLFNEQNGLELISGLRATGAGAEAAGWYRRGADPSVQVCRCIESVLYADSARFWPEEARYSQRCWINQGYLQLLSNKLRKSDYCQSYWSIINIENLKRKKNWKKRVWIDRNIESDSLLLLKRFFSTLIYYFFFFGG